MASMTAICGECGEGSPCEIAEDPSTAQQNHPEETAEQYRYSWIRDWHFFSPFLSSEDSKPNHGHPRAQPHMPRLQLNRSKEMLTCTDSSPSPLGAVINLRGAGAPPLRRLASTTETARSDEERRNLAFINKN